MPEQASPYVGPRPFEREHATLFFGRDREANELVSLIISHTEVLLYAQSGAGKSSLVNARLIPLLEAEDFDVLPPARVQGVMEGIDGVEISNIYAFHTLMTWAGRAADPKRFARMSLADFLQERKCRVDEAGAPVLRIAIFDQFEELFTFYPERWHERRAFFAQVREANKAADPGLRTIFVMREDHVAEVDPYASILPEKLRIRFRLERIREQGALDCIQKPLVSTSRRFAPGVAETLVDQLLRLKVPASNGEPVEAKDQFVELVQLQVVCQSLWDELRPDDDEIGMDDLAAADPGKALLNFYERCVQQTAKRTGVREAKIRRWFERALITPAGTRGTVFRAEHDTQGLPNVAVDALEDLHLIRGEVRGRGRWYELTHDRFIESVQISRQHWSEANAATEAARRSLEASAEQWALQGRAKDGLLDEGQLLEAERLLSLPDVERLGVSDTAHGLVEMSRVVIDQTKQRKEEELRAAKELAAEQQRRAEEQRDAAARQRRFAKILGAVSLIAIVIAIWAFRAEKQARAAETMAVEANNRAQKEKARALDLVRFMDAQIGEAFTNVPVQLRERVSDRLEAFYSSQGEPATFEERHRRMGQHMRKALVHLEVIPIYEKGSFTQSDRELYIEDSRKSAMRELNEALRLGEILAGEAPGNREVTRDRILTRFHLAALGDSNVAAQHLNAARKMLDELVNAGPFPLVLYVDWMGLPNLDAAMGDQAREAGDVPASRAWYDKALELQKELEERRPVDPERKKELKVAAVGGISVPSNGQEAFNLAGYTNGLGMKFVPVPRTQVLFSVHETRVKDFRTFVEETGYVHMRETEEGSRMWSMDRDGYKQRGHSWKDPGFKQTDDHPVVGVSWYDAKAFCEWLTLRERAAGRLPPDRQYRLPTDNEWSVAVGLNEDPAKSLKEKDWENSGTYPWGEWPNQEPPPQGAGNYAGAEVVDDHCPEKFPRIEGFNDPYARTAPVGSFEANRFRLFDMGGNVGEWCEDGEDEYMPGMLVIRGSSWYESFTHDRSLLSSCRNYNPPGQREACVGFRCVVGTSSP